MKRNLSYLSFIILGVLAYFTVSSCDRENKITRASKNHSPINEAEAHIEIEDANGSDGDGTEPPIKEPFKEPEELPENPPAVQEAGDLKVKAVWNDYFEAAKAAEVNLPDSYNATPTQFRARHADETVYAYLTEAFEKLKSVPHLKIPVGDYPLHMPNASKGPAFSLELLKNKVLDFSHSTISMFEPRTFIHLEGSERFALKNVRIVHRYPIASLGFIDVQGGKHLPRVASPYRQDLGSLSPEFHKISSIYQAHPQILAGTPPFMWRKEGSSFRIIDRPLLSNGITGYNTQSGLYSIPDNHGLLASTQKLGGQGTPIIIKHYTYGANGVSANAGRDLTFEGIKIQGVPGMGFYIANVESGVLLRSNLVRANRPENSLALFGATADGIHLARVKGNVIIRNNQIEDTGDDGINVYHGHFFQVESGNSATITVRRLGVAPKAPLLPGFAAALYSNNLKVKNESIPITSVTELEASTTGQQRFQLVHNSGFDSFVAGSDFLTVEEAMAKNVFITENTIKNSTARGILIQAKHAIVKSNHLENIARNAIKITSDTRWFFESGLPRNIKIIDNTIINTTWDHTDAATATTSPSAINALVEIDPQTRVDKKPYGLTGAIKYLSIMNNRVSQVPTSLGHWGVDGIQIFGNEFAVDKTYLDAKKPGQHHGWYIDGPVYGENVANCQSNVAAYCGP